MTIRGVRNTLSLSTEASLCARLRLGRRQNESVRGGGGNAVPPPIVRCVLALLITIFDQLSILSPVVNSLSCYVSQLLC